MHRRLLPRSALASTCSMPTTRSIRRNDLLGNKKRSTQQIQGRDHQSVLEPRPNRLRRHELSHPGEVVMGELQPRHEPPLAFSRPPRALPQSAGVPDPGRNGVTPKETSPRTRGQSHPVPDRPRSLQAPAPERRPAAEPGRAAAAESAGAEGRPVRAQPRRATPRPRQNRSHARRRRRRSGFATVRGAKTGQRKYRTRSNAAYNTIAGIHGS
jgi:hypothetical protein